MPYRDYGLISVLFLRTILPFKVDSRIYRQLAIGFSRHQFQYLVAWQRELLRVKL